MRLNDLTASAFVVRSSVLALVAAIFLASVAGSPPQPARAASGGVQYDQLIKFAMQGTPEPGTFEPDWQASMNAVQAANSQAQHHGLFGSIMNAVNAAKNTVNMFQTGMPSTEYWWNGWERVDDLNTQSATITKPQLHQVIYLDLKNKTYRIEDTTVHPMTQTPPPYEQPRPGGSPPPSPQPGTAKVKITASTTSLGSRVLGGQQADGYKFDFKIQSTHASGSCTNGSFETSMVVWDSRLTEPKLASSGTAVPMVHRPAAPNPELTSFHPGCKPTITARTHIGASPPTGRLAMWQLVGLSAAAQTSQGSGQGGFSTVIERGNVRMLGADAASLFEIPAGFTKAVESPAP